MSASLRKSLVSLRYFLAGLQSLSARGTQAMALCARYGLMHCNKKQVYSITSSARKSNDVGSNPIARAVFKLITC